MVAASSKRERRHTALRAAGANSAMPVFPSACRPFNRPRPRNTAAAVRLSGSWTAVIVVRVLGTAGLAVRLTYEEHRLHVRRRLLGTGRAGSRPGAIGLRDVRLSTQLLVQASRSERVQMGVPVRAPPRLIAKAMPTAAAGATHPPRESSWGSVRRGEDPDRPSSSSSCGSRAESTSPAERCRLGAAAPSTARAGRSHPAQSGTVVASRCPP
jgi:hypothetical protein